MASKGNAKTVGLDLSRAYCNVSPAEIYEHAIRRGEVQLTAAGPINAVTSPHTGRSPRDKFLVREAITDKDVWWGPVNVPMAEEQFDLLHQDVLDYLGQRDELFTRDVLACADPKYRLRVRFISESAWHMLFVYNMFIRPSAADLGNFVAEFTVLHAPEMLADPQRHGTKTNTFIVINFAKKLILIGGTRYAGELKKSIFTVLNYLMPKQDVLSMHCSANDDGNSNIAIFFGLSGTGKTTLSADPARQLVGDDEHGWGEDGIFNFEGGNYAKVINLSKEGEPDIYAASHRFGAVLENVVVNPDRTLDLSSDKITENTRAAYPIDFNPNTDPDGMTGHPNHVVFLTADAWGVLPPIAKLTLEQAIYYFLTGYTAKLAGTERGVTEPQATFSAGFGDVFMVFEPTKYANMLADRLRQHGSTPWLVNTGWTGGPYGEGHRMDLAYTRAMVNAAVSGKLDSVDTREEPVFGLAVPITVPDVPDGILMPRDTWADKNAYDRTAVDLAARFKENFKKFERQVPDEVLAAGPR